VLQTKSGPLNRALSHVRRHFGIDFRRWVPPRDARKVNGGKYGKIQLDDETIERGAYKKYLGGGAEKWESRGLFQLSLLRTAGMLPSSRLLDVGCGPIRAGVHFISFLNAGNYYGVDYNNSFIKAASLLVAEKGFSGKHPTLRVVSDFDFSALNQQFDFVNVFSVLNHCDRQQRRLFFQNIPNLLALDARLFITHAGWLARAHLRLGGLRIIKRFDASELQLEKYGWSEPEQRAVCPIYELGGL
jgi:SAM-dependent methyltransferase